MAVKLNCKKSTLYAGLLSFPLFNYSHSIFFGKQQTCICFLFAKQQVRTKEKYPCPQSPKSNAIKSPQGTVLSVVVVTAGALPLMSEYKGVFVRTSWVILTLKQQDENRSWSSKEGVGESLLVRVKTSAKMLREYGA